MKPPARSGWWVFRAAANWCVVVGAASAAAACASAPGVITQLVDARRIASDLHVHFTKAVDAANRGVMAGSDATATAAAREAEEAKQAVQRDVERLRSMLQSLGYADDLQHLDAFSARFADYQRLDNEILRLAMENTNLEAQRLSFGPAREASDAFRNSLQAAMSAAPKNECCVQALVTNAGAALLDVQATLPRHIAERDDEAMSRMEAQMAASEAAARSTLDMLQRRAALGAAPHLAAAAVALDRFKAITDEIVTLSRRNSNARSLALSLGRKRTVTALCDEQLRALADALARHEFTVTR